VRKKILIGGGIILVAGIWLLWFLGGKALDKKMASALPEKIAQIDTDKDGLADWEEVLWKTNKNNSDTDGDGTSDSAEIAAGRDPKKAGPDDAITNPADRVNALARNAISGKNEPLVSDPATQTGSENFFRLDNIKVASNETKATITKYRDGIRQALGTYTIKMAINSADEVELLVNFVEKNDAKSLSELNASKNNHQELLDTLIGMEVPKGAAIIHLAILNSLKQTTMIISQMTQATIEPLLAMKSSLLLHQQRGEWYTEMIPLNNYFLAQGINMNP